MPEFPPPDRPTGAPDSFAPPAGCVGTIAGVIAACALGFVANRVLSAPTTQAATIALVAVAAASYAGLFLFSLRTRDEARRRFARAALVTVPIVMLALFAVIGAMMSGSTFFPV